MIAVGVIFDPEMFETNFTDALWAVWWTGILFVEETVAVIVVVVVAVGITVDITVGIFFSLGCFTNQIIELIH